MTVTVKSNASLTVPSQVQRRAGIKPGDRVKFKVSGGIINIVREFPSPIGEYSPEQAKIIDAQLAEARKGPYYGPFGTADEAIRFLRKEVRQRRASRSKTAKR